MSSSEVIRIAVPNPFFEGRNSVYLIPSDPITLIDTGVATEKGYRVLSEGLREHDIRAQDIQRIILTHKHVDHIGNAWRFQQQSGAKIYIHQLELPSVTDVDRGGGRFADLVAQKLNDWHAPSSKRKDGDGAMPQWQLESAEAQPLVDGQSLEQGGESLEVIHTPGHTMGSVCLRFQSMLFTGDHVLGDISPNVGGGDLRNRGMLGHFLKSLQRVRELTGLRAMPGHGQPFDDLAKRCDALLQHHEERLARTLEIVLDSPRTVFEVATELFGKLTGFHVVLGCAEANSHLELLAERGAVVFDEGRAVSR